MKRAVDQARMLRGSCDFASREEYDSFLRGVFEQVKRGRRACLEEELRVMGRLPELRVDDFRELKVRLGLSSTIRVAHNVYSISSRLVGEWVPWIR